MDRQYVSVRATPDGAVLTGLSRCTLGHQLSGRADGGPDGVFARWEWQGDCLVAETDRFGLYPLFYWVDDRRVSVSPSVSQLLELGAPSDLDDDAVAVFLRHGFFPGEDTAFRAVRAFPPGCRMTWTNGVVSFSTRRPDVPSTRISRKVAIDGYIDLFRQAIGRRLAPPDQCTVPLTGGRDSRHILFELNRANQRPGFCVTTVGYPPARNEDAQVAARVAAAVGLRHVVVSPGVSRFADNWKAAEVTNFCASGFGQYTGLVDHLRRHVRVSYDGIGGDILSAGLLLTPRRLQLVESDRVSDLFDDLSGDDEDKALRLLLNPAAFRRFNRDAARARFRREFSTHAGNGNPLTSFLFYNRTRRYIGALPFAMMADTVVYAPYLDRDLFDFLMSLPADLTVTKTLHEEAIQTAYPEFRSLPFEKKDIPRDVAGARHYHRCVRDVVSYVATHRRSDLINHRALWPRWCASLVWPSFTGGAEWYYDQLVYLLRLEASQS